MEKRKVFLLALILLIGSASGALIEGTVWDALEMGPLEGAVVEVNTTPMQREVTGPEGEYSFEVSRGEYAIVVKRISEDHELETVAFERIAIEDEGSYSLDVLVFYEDFELPEFGEDEFSFDAGKENGGIDWYPYLALLFFIVMLALYMISAKGKNEGEEKNEPVKRAEQKTKKGEELSEDLNELVEIIRQNEGRMTQKDLRKRMPLSEAKVSLMITELEHLGLVKRIRKGRGNILILKREQ